MAANVPNLESLVLTENDVTSVDALRPLAPLTRLTRLTLLDNPVMQLPDARLAIIHLLPQLRVLNFHKVRQRERLAATEKFGASKPPSSKKRVHADVSTTAGGAAAATAASASTASTSVKRARLTAEQQTELAKKIANATSMAEIQRLEAALRDNRMPDD